MRAGGDWPSATKIKHCGRYALAGNLETVVEGLAGFVSPLPVVVGGDPPEAHGAMVMVGSEKMSKSAGNFPSLASAIISRRSATDGYF